MIKKVFADGSSALDTDQTRPMVKRVASQISMRIGNTIGPGGRNYMTNEGITNDGYSILKEIRFEDEREDDIASAYEEVARRQDEMAGDATTTATLLATALTPLVLDDVIDIETPVPGMKNVMQIKAQLEEEATVASALLKELSTPVTTVEQLTNVAKTSMEKHPSSQLIAETVFKVGKDSNTSIKEGFNGAVTVDVVPGIEYPLKIETPSMFTNATRKEASYENALVIVANHVFEAYSDLSKFMMQMMAEKKASKAPAQPIVIVGKHFSVQFTAQIVVISKQVGLPILLLNAEGLKDEEMQDIAVFCNAIYIDTHPKTGVKMSSLEYKHAGQVKTIIAGAAQTSFIGGDGLTVETLIHGSPETLVQARIVDLNNLASTEQNPEYRKLLLKRAGGLGGGVATIYVDAQTAVDRYYLKKKVEDAVNSCKAALDEGMVRGGGLAFMEVAKQMEEQEKTLNEALARSLYLPTALRTINERIVKNAGGELEVSPDVFDACFSNRCAIENAVAVVKILVTMEGVISIKEQSMVDELRKTLGYE